MKSTLNFVVHINTAARGYPSFMTNSVLNFLEEEKAKGWLKNRMVLLFVYAMWRRNFVNNNTITTTTTTTISIHIWWSLLRSGNFICHFNYSNFHFTTTSRRSSIRSLLFVHRTTYDFVHIMNRQSSALP